MMLALMSDEYYDDKCNTSSELMSDDDVRYPTHTLIHIYIYTDTHTYTYIEREIHTSIPVFEHDNN